jgi:LysM repeat protein
MAASMYHVVRPGETLFAIGRLYAVNPWMIARTNMIPNPNIIFVGQMLVIVRPVPAPFPPGPFPTGPCQTGMCPPGPRPMPMGWNGGCATTYVVKHGDTVYSIGRQFGVAPWSIARASGLCNPNLIVTGQVLCIPAPGPLFAM